MERDYCPWCNTAFGFDPERVNVWPHIVTCTNCQGEIFIELEIQYRAERGYKLPPAIVTHPPRI